MTFWGLTKHFRGKNGALRWSILVGKQKRNVQKPNSLACSPADLISFDLLSESDANYFPA